ncbi:BZ3500_MvSof-1268-A1-R1_Chr1-1g01005 [Microbotryum saponariae]|uniref:BZ3500_MvSof-1268-A1-R1_Chr1-1g01005 protein n=1 Tax=Microbotryum saponariae TaxID=289078 RepID=A0A2X0KP19_9BASI|nr:BZ3500_MvSof-1268-A1-R1_Chr1-1g01005 [Microbotryum saponariae]SCZ93156.1 BZ3501_MvSof-1269-A2-R1_Chr1-1g00602 [Microbotryum saponariae]
MSSPPLPQIKGILFDMDGLLIDSERIYTQVSNQVLAPYGKELTWEIKAGIMGRPALDAATYLVKATGMELEPQVLLELMDAKVQEAFAKVQPLPGAVKLIATGSKAKNMAIKSTHLPHLFEPFRTRIMVGDDPCLQGKGKPDPTIFIEAAKRHLGFDCDESRSRVLVFEDGPPGVRAAKSAGMPVVWVPDPQLLKTMGDHDLDPTQILNSLVDFVPEEWGLPPY